MGKNFFDKLTIGIIIFSILSLYTYAAGGGGGGGSSSGLGFGSRDSVFILVSTEYSQEFSLKNRTKYDLEISVSSGNANVSFGDFFVGLQEGDNFVDLNDDGFADINFNLINILNERRANIRIIDARNIVEIAKKPQTEKVQSESRVPEEAEHGDEIKCGNLATIGERISCRLDLDKEEQVEELEVYFMPEECRLLQATAQDSCINRYHSVQPCWSFPIGPERVACVKKIMNLGNINEEKILCNSQACSNNLKNKVYNLIKWRFYDLEERAEGLMLRGLAKRSDVVDFVVKTELNKVNFNQAENNEERKNIILDVRQDWQNFVKKVREGLRGNDEIKE